MKKTKIEIIYSDSELLIVNKPTGVSVTKDRSGAAQLTDLLKKQLPPAQVESLRLIHRLDKLTSGILILAKTPQAQSQYSSYFAKKLVRKTYLAIVNGAVIEKKGRIKGNIEPSKHTPGKMTLTHRKGKDALTEWKLLADFGLFALLSVSPITGRTHQIRLHLKKAQMQLAIDPLYGSDKPLMLSDIKSGYHLGKRKTENPLIERLTLHAYQLQFSSPQKDRPDSFNAELDKKFKATIKMLTRHNPKSIDAFIDPEDYEKIINGQTLT